MAKRRGEASTHGVCVVDKPPGITSHDVVGLLRRRFRERQVGHAGPPGRKATEALSKYIVVDMFAKSIQGMAPEEAVKWAAGELRKIYG